MEIPRIYVVNLNSYINMKTRGRWYDLPVDFRQIQRDLLLDEEHGEEYAIHDSENFYGYSVSEYSSIKELNDYARKLKELSEVEHIEDYLQAFDSIEEVLERKDDLFFVQAGTEEDFAEEMIELWGGVETLSNDDLETYFNYSAFGRDLIINDYIPTKNGYVRKI